MYEIGIRVDGTQTFKTYDIRATVDMVPGVTYQAVFDFENAEPGWEEQGYETLRDEFASYGCELTYLGTCYPNKKIIVQWQLNPQTGFTSAALPAIPAAVLVLAALGVIGAGIGGVSFFKFSELYDKNTIGIGLLAGGVVVVGLLFAIGYAARSVR